MDSYKLALKFFVKNPPVLHGSEFIPVFHKWIQTHAVADHLVIDVADYHHVHEGPGTLLVTLEANFAMDKADGKLGLLYQRKQPFPDAGSFAQRLPAVMRPILEAAKRLEEEPSFEGKIKFATDAFLFRVYDRLLAPNNAETLSSVKPELEAFITRLYGKAPISLERNTFVESLFEVMVKTSSSPTIGELLGRL